MKYCPDCGSKLASRMIDENERYVCTNKNCSYIYWNNPVPVVAALVKHDDKYIIARNVKWPRGIFSVITGYLEQQETPEQAVIREVHEELGLKAEITKLIGNYAFREKGQVILCYEVAASGSVRLNHELAELKRLSPGELLDYDFSPLYVTENIMRDWAKTVTG